MNSKQRRTWRRAGNYRVTWQDEIAVDEFALTLWKLNLHDWTGISIIEREMVITAAFPIALKCLSFESRY